MLDIQNFKSDTISGTFVAGATSATLAAGNFPNGRQALVVDYDNLKREEILADVNGTSLTNITRAVAGTDVEHASGASVALSFTKTHYDAIKQFDGWIPCHQTWTYASATTITVPTDATTIYSVGDKIRWKQGGAYKYAVVTTVAATLLTVSGEAVTNAGITDNYYSKANSPVGIGGSGVLGYAEITSDITTSSSTVAQVAGLTSAVTIPAGGRYVKVTAYAYLRHSLAGEIVTMSIWDGTVGSGTQIAQAAWRAASENQDAQQMAVAYVKPSAGAKTYNVGIKIGTNATGVGSIIASATNKAYLAVEYLGGI